MKCYILKISFLALIFLLSLALETDAEPRRKKNRNRNNRRRNNDYSDDEDESLLGQFSGDSYADFMERYYGGNSFGGDSSRGANNFGGDSGRDHSRSSILGSTYIDQEDDEDNVEGSGLSDDEDYDDIESSGDRINPGNDNQYLPNSFDTTTRRIIYTQR